MLTSMYECGYCGALVEGESYPRVVHSETHVHIAERVMSVGGPMGNRPVPPIFHDCEGHVGIAVFVGFRKGEAPA